MVCCCCFWAMFVNGLLLLMLLFKDSIIFVGELASTTCWLAKGLLEGELRLDMGCTFVNCCVNKEGGCWLYEGAEVLNGGIVLALKGFETLDVFWVVTKDMPMSFVLVLKGLWPPVCCCCCSIRTGGCMVWTGFWAGL